MMTSKEEKEHCSKCGNNHNLGSANWTLAGLLCAYRANRPDEWTMDEFIRKALKQELEIKVLRTSIDDIEATSRSNSDACVVCDNINDLAYKTQEK